jgi:hypothetical protein
MRRVGVVALVLAGIWALAQAIDWLGVPLDSITNGGGLHYRFVLFIPPVGAALLGIVLIVARRRLSERLFDEQPAGTSLDIALLMRAGIAIIGIALAVFAVPRLVYNIVWPFTSGADFFSMGERFREVLASIISNGTQLIFGIALAVFSRRLAGLFWPGRRSRSAGKPAPALAQCPSCGAPYDPAEYKGGLFNARCMSCKEPLNPGDA